MRWVRFLMALDTTNKGEPVMANIISADDIVNVTGGAYLTAEDKASLHAEQRPFWCRGAVAEQEGHYGVQTIFEIVEKGKEPANLAFAASRSRIEQAKRITQHMANGADGVGPFYLGRWTANGKSGWQLTNAPSEVMEIPPTTAQAVETAKVQRVAEFDASVAGDDLPF